jgi:RNA polymerase sigma-70 factor (ECF subfamily)
MGKVVETDEQLMAQVAQNCREPLGILLRRFASPLLTFIQRMVGDRHRSEELFQEVFLAVWTERRRYQYPRPFRAWLYGIALNKCRNDFRRHRSFRLTPTESIPLVVAAGAGGPAEAAVATETAAIVQAAVARLPEQQRMVVVLRVWNGLPYFEIAKILERAESTVRSEMFHALASLRKFLEPRLRS